MKSLQKLDTTKKYGTLEINKKSGKIINDGKELKIPIKERDILFYLEENIGLVKTREEILLSVWGYDFDGNDRVIDKQITKLRGRLGKNSKYLKTIKSIGYKFEE
ncbi:winged helix-turn-helix domain-containing protein [Fusobacterium sp. PH5-44]|uniref:winged helix-turn-helix domain-containing protein n=1 Tax=unclassified Fusobacterium TaxID=2648384 RepID=UPI003D24727D